MLVIAVILESVPPGPPKRTKPHSHDNNARQANYAGALEKTGRTYGTFVFNQYS